MKTFIMPLKWLAVASVSLLYACSSNNSVEPVVHQLEDGITIKNGRLSFKDGKVLERKLVELKKLSSEDGYTTWEAKLPFTSLRKYVKSQKNEYQNNDVPKSLLPVLNENSELIVGTEIIWYSNGFAYVSPNLDEDLLKKIKSDPSNCSRRYKIEHQVMPPKVSDKQTSGTISAGEKKSSPYQYVWSPDGRPKDEPWRKVVYELVAEDFYAGYINGNPSSYFELYVNVKLEYFDGNGGYHTAGETRIIEKFQMTGGVYWGFTNHPIDVNLPYQETNTDISVVLYYTTKQYGYNYYGTNDPSWSWTTFNYTLSGDIITKSRWGTNSTAPIPSRSMYQVSGTLWE